LARWQSRRGLWLGMSLYTPYRVWKCINLVCQSSRLSTLCTHLMINLVLEYSTFAILSQLYLSFMCKQLHNECSEEGVIPTSILLQETSWRRVYKAGERILVRFKIQMIDQ
jgi:hypothetical protein